MGEAYAALCQEPWAMTPPEFAALTDWQIAELYFRPAAERSEQMKRDTPALNAPHAGQSVYAPPPGEVPPPEPGTPAFKLWCINKFVSFGLSHAEAVAQYEAQNAQWLREQGKGG
jgi:hypothetical protein